MRAVAEQQLQAAEGEIASLTAQLASLQRSEQKRSPAIDAASPSAHRAKAELLAAQEARRGAEQALASQNAVAAAAQAKYKEQIVALEKALHACDAFLKVTAHCHSPCAIRAACPRGCGALRSIRRRRRSASRLNNACTCFSWSASRRRRSLRCRQVPLVFFIVCGCMCSRVLTALPTRHSAGSISSG